MNSKITPPTVNPATNHHFHFAAFSTLFCLILFISFAGCRKLDISSQGSMGDSKKFTKVEAKEWWYGDFRKSQVFKQYNLQSSFYKALKSINNDISPNDWSPEKRFPSWKNAIAKTSGKLTIIELPLYSSLTTSFVPVRAEETSLDRERIVGATVHKALIIRNNETNETNVRVLTIVPSISYMKGNSMTPLSYINLSTIFSGYIYIRNWNENLISALKYNKGKRQKFDPFEKSNDSDEIRVMSSSNCDGTWDVVGYRQFCITVHQADEPDPCDDPSNWGSRPIIGLTVPGDCDYGEYYDPCFGMSSADCECLQLGVCNDGPIDDNWEDEDCQLSAENSLSEIISNTFPMDEVVSIEAYDIKPERKTFKYKTKVLKNTSWNLYSWELGTQIKRPNTNPQLQWRWEKIEQLGLHPEGNIFGGKVTEFNLVNRKVTMGDYNAVVDYLITMQYELQKGWCTAQRFETHSAQIVLNVNDPGHPH